MDGSFLPMQLSANNNRAIKNRSSLFSRQRWPNTIDSPVQGSAYSTAPIKVFLHLPARPGDVPQRHARRSLFVNRISFMCVVDPEMSTLQLASKHVVIDHGPRAFINRKISTDWFISPLLLVKNVTTVKVRRERIPSINVMGR